MAQIKLGPQSVVLLVSASETYAWAHRPHAVWPCSQLAGHRFRAAFDQGGLVEFTIDGRDGDVDAGEFNAISYDFLVDKLPPEHPAYDVAVGQFKPELK
jgi:hypothetical protein